MVKFIQEWWWVILNSFVWGYAGYSFQKGRARERRYLREMSPRERRSYEAIRQMDKKVRRKAFRHPFWGKEKREEFIKPLVAETMLTTLGYEKGDPCPIHCNRGYVDGFDPSKHQFPERMPCPACKIIKEVHGVAPN